MVVNCKDGVRRRIYHRLFTYSADYPEKYVPFSLRDRELNQVQSGCLLLRSETRASTPALIA